MEFDRAQAFGKRLDIASGTSVRFEPGEEKNVNLIDFGGKQKIIGFNDLTNAHINKENKEQCLANAAQKHFIH